MDRDWLLPSVLGCARAFDAEAADARLRLFRELHPELDAGVLIRRFAEHRLRERGVVYGTPLASEQTITDYTVGGFRQRQAVFLALLMVQAELVLEIGCALGHRPRGPVEILVCLALLCRDFRLAERLHAALAAYRPDDEPSRALRKQARRLGRRYRARAYLAGNPLLGLPVHNSFAYVDAKTAGRLAVVYYERGRVDRRACQRVLDYQDRERELLLQALLGLTQADRQIGVSSRRVMIEQIRAARLPRAARRTLLKMLRKPVSPLTVAAAVGDERTRDFLVEQVMLGALLDGYQSEQEWGFIADLADLLGVAPEELARREAELVAFYEQHRAFLDLFTVGTAVRDYRQRMLDRLKRAIAENLGRIVQEIKQTGDLADLLYRASSGERLSAEEWKKVRRQLIDVARTVPSLAIFTLPGGAVLLPLIYKVLPDGLKPRSFADKDGQAGLGPDIL
ncbi:MAG: DUF533 domain-containing protein [Deltaproteobacteria bacterium]|nr:DUF533 domain-containing protein [Deltaproteobacteria bacterium]